MDLNRIRKKIDDDKYKTLEQMGTDVDLLCNNAQVIFFFWVHILQKKWINGIKKLSLF